MVHMLFSWTDRRSKRSTRIEGLASSRYARKASPPKWHVREWLGILTPHVRPATLSEIEPRIDHLLETKLNYLSLPADVKAAFRDTTRRGRRIWMASWSICIAALNLLTGSFDIGILSGATLRETLLFRLVVSAAFAASAGLLTFAKPRRFDEFIVILPPVITLLFAGMAGMSANSDDLFHHYMTMAIVTASTGVALLPIELNTTILCAVFSFAIMLVFTFLRQQMHIAEELQDAGFFGSVFGALVFARYSQNANQYRIFLLKKKKDILLFQQTRHNAQLSTIAYTDPLTDIPNRRYFGEMIEAIEVNPKLYLPLAICMMDIDAFKNLNDKCGHGEGDRCLRQVATTLRGYLRHNSDVVARYGGEEFVLILPHTDAEHAIDVAERMRKAVLDLDYPNPGTPLGRISMSAGVAIADDPGQVRSLIEAADLALYQAKETGRNRTVVIANAA
jgi:diguanylate cyclase (GGDEF)-like protein